MTLAKSSPLPPLKAPRAPNSSNKLTNKVLAPQLTRRSSSVDKITRLMLQQVDMRFRTLREAFRAVDRDASGGIDRDEMQAALFSWHVPCSGHKVDALMAAFDRNRDQNISYSEFCEALKPFSVRSQPIFGLSDQFVTDKHRVLPDEHRVLLNDNLTHVERPAARGQGVGRRDFQLIDLPSAGSGPASPEVLKEHALDLSNRIHVKYRRLKDAFRSFDENKDGKLSSQELMMAVRCFNLPFPQAHIMQLARLCDTNADGLIDYNEFAALLKRKDALGH